MFVGMCVCLLVCVVCVEGGGDGVGKKTQLAITIVVSNYILKLCRFHQR